MSMTFINIIISWWADTHTHARACTHSSNMTGGWCLSVCVSDFCVCTAICRKSSLKHTENIDRPLEGPKSPFIHNLSCSHLHKILFTNLLLHFFTKTSVRLMYLKNPFSLLFTYLTEMNFCWQKSVFCSIPFFLKPPDPSWASSLRTTALHFYSIFDGDQLYKGIMKYSECIYL